MSRLVLDELHPDGAHVIRDAASSEAQLKALFDELAAKLKGNFSIDIVVRGDFERIARVFCKWLLERKKLGVDGDRLIKASAEAMWISTGADELVKMCLVDGTAVLPGMSGNLRCPDRVRLPEVSKDVQWCVRP